MTKRKRRKGQTTIYKICT